MNSIRNAMRVMLALPIFVCALAISGVKYPPLIADPNQQQAYILQLMQEYPWLAPTGIAANLPNYVALQQQWLPNFYQIPQFKKLNADRPDLLTIKVQTVTRQVQNVKVLSDAKVNAFRQQVAELVSSHWPSEDETPLLTEINDRLRTLTASDPQKILVGLVSLLPQQKRQNYFKASFEKQLEMLANDPDFTNEVIAENFQAELHRLENVNPTTVEMLNAVKELVAEEQELIALLRAQYALTVIYRDPHLGAKLEKGDVKGALQIIMEAGPEAFDIGTESEAGSVDRFLKSLVRGGKDQRGLVTKYLERIIKAMKNEERVVEKREVPVANDLFTIQEIIPELGVYRGIMGGDCSTTNSYAFPFSPLERVFLIFDKNGDPMRLYFSGTLLMADKKRAFYLHDLAGPALTKEIQSQVLHSLYEVRDVFGAQIMTLSTRTVQEANAGEEPSQSPRIMALIEDMNRYMGAEVKHQYLDTEVRTFLGRLPNSEAKYDSPETNAIGHLFVPKKNAMEGMRAIVLGGGADAAIDNEPDELGPKETFLRLLDLLAGEEKPEMFFDNLGIERAETERILAVVNNKQNLKLKDYYAAMTKEFARYDIELSEKFMRKNSRYFIFGHLQAQDTITTRDEALLDKTVKFTIETIRRGRVRKFAYDLVAANSDFFNGNQEFMEYVSTIPLRGEDNLRRLELLISGGISPDRIAWNEKAVANVTEANYEALQRAAMRWFSNQNGAAHAPEYLALLAKALHNEKHKSDETSLEAVSLLMNIRTDDPEVIKSLTQTVKHDENIQIAYRAAVALVLNNQVPKKAHSMLHDNQNNPELPPGLLATGNKLLQKLGPPPCATQVADNNQPKRK